MDRGAWRAAIHRVTKSRTQLKQLSTHARMHLYEHDGMNRGPVGSSRLSKEQRLLLETGWDHMGALVGGGGVG